jgi:predicted metal-dependent phosphoesterase TrpH
LNNFDLHNHSVASDGLSTARELVGLAKRNGCDALALTDHDTVDGTEAASVAASELGLRFIPGVEISVSWEPDIDSRPATLHIVGLGISPAHPVLAAGLAGISAGRIERARKIGCELEAAGIPGMFARAYELAESKTMVGRTHFARALAEAGKVRDVADAFERYLTPGHPGYVPHRWAALDAAIAWIRAAGGVAVLAHPGRYPLSSSQMQHLLETFKDLGGEAIEVVTGSHEEAQYREYARHARRFGFMGSRGADYHGPGESRFEPGQLPPLPDEVKPVWHALV